MKNAGSSLSESIAVFQLLYLTNSGFRFRVLPLSKVETLNWRHSIENRKRNQVDIFFQFTKRRKPREPYIQDEKHSARLKICSRSQVRVKSSQTLILNTLPCINTE